MITQKNVSRKKIHKENYLHFIPLGGVGEIGKNMYVIEYDDNIIVIDAGLKFADQSMPGIDFIVPDISYLEKNREKVLGIILTHGHEDHIGALTSVLPRLNVPLYGTSLTLGMVSQKFSDELPNYIPNLKEIHAGITVDIGPFKIRLMSVTHSIPDGVGISIETPIGRILHSGDFKFDSTPIDNILTDYAGFAEEGKKGVLLLLSDSTNAEKAGFTPSESVIGGTLERIFRAYKSRRIIISAFMYKSLQISTCCISPMPKEETGFFGDIEKLFSKINFCAIAFAFFVSKKTPHLRGSRLITIFSAAVYSSKSIKC